jgi:methionyl-tRNA formyltransferase
VLNRVVDGIGAGTATAVPQSHEGVSYCSVISKDDGAVDWSASACEIQRMVRAYHPWPTAHTSREGRQLAILAATCADGEERDGSVVKRPGTVIGLDKRRGILIQTGNGILAVQRLQLQSKKALDFKSFWNGVQGFDGAVLGRE